MSSDSKATSTPPEEVWRAIPTLVRNVFWNWGGFAFSAIVNFFLAPFVVRHLGNSLYGISVLMMSLTGYLGLLDMGVRGAMTRYIARFRVRCEHDEARRFTSTALVGLAAAGILIVLLSIGMAVWAGSFSIPGISVGRTRVLYIFGGLNVAASLISGVFSGIPMALQRFDRTNAIAILSTILRASLIVLALSAGGGLIALVCIQLFFTVSATLASAWVSLRLYPQLRVRIGEFNRLHGSLILSFSVYSFCLLCFDTGIIYLDALVLGTFQSANLVTFFWIAASLVIYTRALVTGIAKISTPLSSSLDAQGDARGLQLAVLNGASYATLIILPIAVTFLFRGRLFIALWMGADYAELSGRVLWILTIGLAFSASNQVALASMLGISKHRGVLLAFMVQALCLVVLCLATVRPWGAVGVAWSTTLLDLTLSLFFWPWYLQRSLQISARRYVYSTWMKPGLAVIPFALGTFLVQEYWPTPNLVLFFFETAAILPAALAGFWYIYFTREQRSDLARVFLLPVWSAIRLRF